MARWSFVLRTTFILIVATCVTCSLAAQATSPASTANAQQAAPPQTPANSIRANAR